MMKKKTQQTNGLLTIKDLNQIATRSFMLQSSFNFESMQGIGYAYSVLPALQKIYADDPEGLKEAVLRNTEFFNTHPYLAGTIMGAQLALEERKHTYNDISSEAISSIKIAMMGPFAGIGDSFFWYTIYPIAISVGCSLADAGSILGPIFAFVFFNTFHLVARYGGIKMGYNLGTDAIKNSTSSLMNRITQGASIVGLMILGCLTVNYVNFEMTFMLGGEGGLNIQRDVLDAVLPKMIPLGLVWLVYRLVKKRVSTVKIMIALIIFSIVAAVIGII